MSRSSFDPVIPVAERPRVAIVAPPDLDYDLMARKLDVFLEPLRYPLFLVLRLGDLTEKLSRWCGRGNMDLQVFHPDLERFPPVTATGMAREEMIRMATHVVAFDDGNYAEIAHVIEAARAGRRKLRVVEI